MLVAYVAGIGFTVYACPLLSTESSRRFDFLFANLFSHVFRPIHAVLEQCGMRADTVTPYALDMAVRDFFVDRVRLEVQGAALATRPASKKAALSKMEKEQAADREEEPIEEVQALWQKLVDEDSDVASVCASEDSSMDTSDDESAEDTSDEEADSGAEELPRAPRGTHVVRSNGYFTFLDNRTYPDVKVQVLPKWSTEEHMGATLKSRTVVPSHFGDSRAPGAQHARLASVDVDEGRHQWVLRQKVCAQKVAHARDLAVEGRHRPHELRGQAHDWGCSGGCPHPPVGPHVLSSHGGSGTGGRGRGVGGTAGGTLGSSV